MGAVKGKWTEKVVCATSAEAQVKKDEFRRKGMIARIRRNPARYQSGTPIGGTWIVQARIPKKGLNTYWVDLKNQPPLRLVKWPVVITTTTRTRTGKDWKGNWEYEETTTKTAGIETKAVRIKESDVKEAVAAEQEKVDAEIGN